MRQRIIASSKTKQFWRISICLTACLGVCSVGPLAAEEAPQLAIFQMKLDGSELKKVAQAEGKRWHASPSWSPDGYTILFHAFPNDDTTGDSHVYSVKPDGSDLKDLGLGENASWSTDGKQIVFGIAQQNPEKAQAGLWIMNADGKGRQWIFPGTSARYAPDGSRILYVSHHEGNQSIYVYDLVDSTPKKILQETYERRPGFARWSPDGKRVAFVDERKGKTELILFDAHGSEKSQLVRHRGLISGSVAWAPNAQLVICQKDTSADDRQQLFLLNPENDDSPEILPQQDAGKYNFDPEWSPDGQHILFVSDRVLP